MMARLRISRYVLTVGVIIVGFLGLYKHFIVHIDRPLPAVITEESYEGALYWLHAAAVDTIPPQGNTLLYFGITFQNNPVQLPAGKDTIQIVKSNVDVSAHFHKPKSILQTALQSGLVNHIVWVWPEWEGDGRPNHVQGKISAGKNGKAPCSCLEIEGQARVCHALKGETELFQIDAKSCELYISCTYEEFNVKTAYEKFADHATWTERGQKGLIIHIDEEFFSSMNRRKFLDEAALNGTGLMKLNTIIGQHYCPVNSDLEFAADELATDVITNFIVKCGNVDEHNKCSSQASDDDLVDKFMTDFDSIFMDQETARVFCTKDMDINRKRVTQIVQIMKLMNKKQLYAIQQTGFCLNKAPSSSKKVTGLLFQLCYGNVSSASKFYSASPSELSMTLDFFGQLLGIPSLPDPSIVTLSRSMRTGTTNPNDFSQIENSILESLDTLGFIRHYRLEERYDTNLLGGIDGWTKRRAYMFAVNDLNDT